MPIKVIYSDLRMMPGERQRSIVDRQPDMTARGALQHVIGIPRTQQVIDDLEDNNPILFVSWMNTDTEEVSGIGGAASLDWHIDDRTILVVEYQEDLASGIDSEEHILWMLEFEQQPW